MSKASGLIKTGLALLRLAKAIEPIRPSTAETIAAGSTNQLAKLLNQLRILSIKQVFF